MTKQLHPKIQQLRRNVAGIYCASGYNEPLDYRIKSDGLTTEGYLAVFGTRDSYGTVFVKGCFAKSIQERGPASLANDKIAFLCFHDIEKAAGQFTELEEDNYGLRFVAKHSKDVQRQRETGVQINDGTYNQFSVGFNYIWDKVTWDDRIEAALIGECDLREGTVLIIMAANTDTHAIRSTEEKTKALLDLGEKAELFLNKLPRATQLELRKLLTEYKTLASVEPEPTKETLSARSKPDNNLVAIGGYKLDKKQFLTN